MPLATLLVALERRTKASLVELEPPQLLFLVGVVVPQVMEARLHQGAGFPRQ
jgi:hypothetical protein